MPLAPPCPGVEQRPLVEMSHRPVSRKPVDERRQTPVGLDDQGGDQIGEGRRGGARRVVGLPQPVTCLHPAAVDHVQRDFRSSPAPPLAQQGRQPTRHAELPAVGHCLAKVDGCGTETAQGMHFDSQGLLLVGRLVEPTEPVGIGAREREDQECLVPHGCN